MAAVLPLDHRTGATAAVRGIGIAAPPVHIDHVLDCVAGFFVDRADAELTMAQLRQTRGMLPTQQLLLGPADAAWLPFRRRSRQWARGPDAMGQTWKNDPRLVALLGAVLALPLIVIALLFVDSLTLASALALIVSVVLTGAAVGAGMACRWRVSRQYQKFDQLIRAGLAAGRWVVVAHDVPWVGQAAMVKVLREGSVHWCAVSSAPRRL